MKKTGENRGITLIALVITIIVLLILAGISIMMLTGDNSILNQATNAKRSTIEGQEKEAITLAYNGVLANTQGAGVTAEDLQRELQANGNDATAAQQGDKIVVTFGSGNVYTVDSNGNIQLKNGNNSGKELKLSFNQVETESRAVILRVTATLGEVPTEDDLKELSEEKLKEMFLTGIQNVFGVTLTWDDVEEECRENATVNSAFTSLGLSDGYSNEYDFVIQTGGYAKEAIFTCNGETISGTKAEFVITKNGTYTVTATNDDKDSGSETVSVTKCLNNGEEEKYSSRQDDDTNNNYVMVISKDNKQVPVPKGFAYGTSNNVGTVSTGFVITDSVDSDGYSNGNEFVWIPVATPVADTEEDGTINKAMAVKIGDNYRGLLYNFSGESSTVISGCTSTNFTNESGYREPAYLASPDYGDASEYNTIGITQNSLQGEYNAMIESIKTHGGFYVARYEMAIQNEKAISKIGVSPTSAANSETEMWYGLYSKAKTYTNSKNSIQSSMMWGSQYDAMLNFALTGADKSKVTATGNGNYSIIILKTGLTRTSDSINNIYDLEGNLYEWVLEAYSNTSHYPGRAKRGGYHDDYIYSPSYRSVNEPGSTDSNYGSRLSLYIK